MFPAWFSGCLVARIKTQKALKSSEKNPLEQKVHIPVFEIEIPKKRGEQGHRKSASKIRVIIALENRDGKPGRGPAKVIEDYFRSTIR